MYTLNISSEAIRLQKEKGRIFVEKKREMLNNLTLSATSLLENSISRGKLE